MVGAPPGLLDAPHVERLFSLLHHRGPDDRGWLTLDHTGVRTGSGAEALAGDVVLLHTRLSILDLSAAGHQPMSTRDGRFHLSFNGEIYNYLELREELVRLGRTFASGTDTEVLLTAYAEWGAGVFDRLVGMFALALVDSERRLLVLARDQFGIKPLYYARLGGGLAFASEAPPLLTLPGVSRRANPQRVFDYLRFGRTDHGTETMFAEIRQVEPGSHVEVPLDHPHALRHSQYWRLEPQPADGLSLDEAAERLQELFLDSVRIHLRSDVPVGAAFSGGVDSSANVAAMRRLCGPGLDLHTFSYVADDPALNEKRWMELVGREAGAVGHTVEPSPQELAADLDRLIEIQGEPFGGTSIYAQYRVFRLAREAGIKVMLDGQGADELFAGYRYYLPDRIAGLLSGGRLVATARLLAAISTLPGATPAGMLARAVGHALPKAAQGPARRLTPHRLVPAWFNEHWLRGHHIRADDPGRNSRGSLREYRLDTVRTGLRELLRYEDRNSMAFSIESRVPFLTPALAEFAAGMPDDYLIAPDGTGKLVLRESLRGLVPDPILDRRDKIGFATPEASWLRALTPWIDEVLAVNSGRVGGPLVLTLVRRRLQEMIEGTRPYEPLAWRWLNLIRWADRLDVKLD
jgi:asparagine synthase (glutamine-hydrolysing)